MRAAQSGQTPQKVTSATCTAKPCASEGVEAGGGADGAVDVLDGAAFGADEVVVVVGDAQLEQPGAAGGLDAAHEAGVREVAERVVDRLQARARDASRDDRLNSSSALACGRSPRAIDDRASRLGDPQSRGADDGIRRHPHGAWRRGPVVMIVRL